MGRSRPRGFGWNRSPVPAHPAGQVRRQGGGQRLRPRTLLDQDNAAATPCNGGGLDRCQCRSRLRRRQACFPCLQRRRPNAQRRLARPARLPTRNHGSRLRATNACHESCNGDRPRRCRRGCRHLPVRPQPGGCRFLETACPCRTDYHPCTRLVRHPRHRQSEPVKRARKRKITGPQTGQPGSQNDEPLQPPADLAARNLELHVCGPAGREIPVLPVQQRQGDAMRQDQARLPPPDRRVLLQPATDQLKEPQSNTCPSSSPRATQQARRRVSDMFMTSDHGTPPFTRNRIWRSKKCRLSFLRYRVPDHRAPPSPALPDNGRGQAPPSRHCRCGARVPGRPPWSPAS